MQWFIPRVHNRDSCLYLLHCTNGQMCVNRLPRELSQLGYIAVVQVSLHHVCLSGIDNLPATVSSHILCSTASKLAPHSSSGAVPNWTSELFNAHVASWDAHRAGVTSGLSCFILFMGVRFYAVITA